ncbi:hypothetical protein EDB19DRAFT_1919005 [Suillus lakei]|nr:hypothetical protein EDB19DRAFT_1919005 [Suillus lakei]
MASTSTKAATMNAILNPVMTLKGHGEYIPSISYFPDGKRMISGSQDKTARQWDLKAGKEIEEAPGVCEKDVQAVAVSRDSRWVITAGGRRDRAELKAYEVETGIAKTFEGHSEEIDCIDISMEHADGKRGTRCLSFIVTKFPFPETPSHFSPLASAEKEVEKHTMAIIRFAVDP